MANETLYSSNVTVAAAVEAAILPVFTAASIMGGLVAPFNPGLANTNAKKLPKAGSVTASVISEGSAATAQALTDTSVTLTLQKAVVVTKPTAEALMFATGANPQRHADEHARACADKFDIDAMALFDGFSTSVDSGTTLTVAKLQEAAYNLRLNKVPYSRIVAVLHTKQAWQLGNDIRTSSGAFYGNQNFSTEIVNGKIPSPGFWGKVFNIEVFESPNVAAQGGDNVSGVYNPEAAIAALYPTGRAPSFATTISDELGFLESVKHIKTLMWYQLAEYADLAGVELRCDT